MKDIVVLYHKDCPDGFSAAWVAWTKLGDKADYVPVIHQLPPPEGLTDKTIYMVDFVYPGKILDNILENNKKVIVLDHHESVEHEVKRVPGSVYDVNHSGAVITWQYFYPGAPIPKLLKYVEDVDLWNLKLPHTREIEAFLERQPRNFEGWGRLAHDLENEGKFQEYINEGRAMVEYKNALVEEIASQADLVSFDGHDVFAINYTNAGMLTSEIGHTLYIKKPPFSIIWGERANGIKVSMRSDGTVDVSEIAKKYGGGGHKASAGFRLPPGSDLPWEYIK